MDRNFYNDLTHSGLPQVDFQMFSSPQLVYVGSMNISHRAENLLQVLFHLRQIWSDVTLTYLVTADEHLNDSNVQREVSRLGLATSVHIREYRGCRERWHLLKHARFHFTSCEFKPLFYSNSICTTELHRLFWQAITISLNYLYRSKTSCRSSMLSYPAIDLANLIIWAHLNPRCATQIFHHPVLFYRFLQFCEQHQRTNHGLTVSCISQAVPKILIGKQPIGAREYV